MTLVLFCGIPADEMRDATGTWSNTIFRAHVNECPQCQAGTRLVQGLLGSRTSEKKAAASKRNALLGGRPRKDKETGK